MQRPLPDAAGRRQDVGPARAGGAAGRGGGRRLRGTKGKKGNGWRRHGVDGFDGVGGKFRDGRDRSFELVKARGEGGSPVDPEELIVPKGAGARRVSFKYN